MQTNLIYENKIKGKKLFWRLRAYVIFQDSYPIVETYYKRLYGIIEYIRINFLA